MRQNLALAFVVALGLLGSSPAQAESGKLNLHLDLGIGTPIAGPLRVNDTDFSLGGFGWLSADYQPFSPFSVELIAGFGYIGDAYQAGDSSTLYGTLAAGVRLRFMDNRVGYMNEEGGDALGNFWVSVHAGYHHLDGSQFGLDGALGYEFSVASPLQLGVFLRSALTFAGNIDGVDSILVLGVNGSIELLGRTAELDSDGDGLSNEREINEHGTDPNRADTDADGLPDGIEVNHETNATNPDTDGDGLVDGREDANANGSVDDGETDPRTEDTDGGGVSDGYEVQNGTNALSRADDDQDLDTVLNDRDQCPGTAEGTEVDERGCAVIRAQMVLPGITFALNSAEILPASERTLNIARQILSDNPDARVEVGGHTDNTGARQHNMQLSRARADSVKAWLSGHGIEASRMTTRGYGPTQPAATNETEEGRAQNRRIEFSRIDE
ncbi:MAG: OmpA family protein [Polyangiales bacterium]